MERAAVPAGGGDDGNEPDDELSEVGLETPTVMLKDTATLRGESRSVVPGGRASTLLTGVARARI
jgi:hypothetical protein